MTNPVSRTNHILNSSVSPRCILIRIVRTRTTVATNNCRTRDGVDRFDSCQAIRRRFRLHTHCVAREEPPPHCRGVWYFHLSHPNSARFQVCDSSDSRHIYSTIAYRNGNSKTPLPYAVRRVCVDQRVCVQRGRAMICRIHFCCTDAPWSVPPTCASHCVTATQCRERANSTDDGSRHVGFGNSTVYCRDHSM